MKRWRQSRAYLPNRTRGEKERASEHELCMEERKRTLPSSKREIIIFSFALVIWPSFHVKHSCLFCFKLPVFVILAFDSCYCLPRCQTRDPAHSENLMSHDDEMFVQRILRSSILVVVLSLTGLGTYEILFSCILFLFQHQGGLVPVGIWYHKCVDGMWGGLPPLKLHR